MFDNNGFDVCFLVVVSCRESGIRGVEERNWKRGCRKAVFGVGNGVCNSQHENKRKSVFF